MISHILYQLLLASLSSSAKLQFNQPIPKKYRLLVFSKLPKLHLGWIVLILLCLALFFSKAFALTINVVNPNGDTIDKYRWLIEEDASYHVTPGIVGANLLRFHRSYMPVTAKGDETNSTDIPLDANKHYFVSILPKAVGKLTIGGAPIKPGQSTVTVTLNKLPLPTAQITVFVFEDNYPINNAPDLPQEQGLADFSLLLEDAGGRYGISAGHQSKDAFGNPLGTTYDKKGDIVTLGTGIIKTDQYGMAIIDNLAPGKYGIQVVPPAGANWVQTTTIEGTKTVDAWVKANEPPYLQEFGAPTQHVMIGFVQPMNDPNALNGSNTISGRVVNLHLSRPPESAFYAGSPFEHTIPWIGLNDMVAGADKGVYAQRANADGTFTIPNVPPGDYQLVVWDEYLDLIIDFRTVTVSDGDVALGDIAVFDWFNRLETYVFHDSNENGFWDAGEEGIPEQNVNIRFRDGSLYQSMPTDISGAAPFDQLFPFFNWLVAEVDFARFKATGATITVDNGGPVAPGEVLNPQPQPQNDNNLWRTETGAVLLEAFQGMLGQTNRIEFGKTHYDTNENGGISGIVYYSTTRAENDPQYAAAEPWEPGIPNVTVRLWGLGADNTANTEDDVLLNETQTDSWDNDLPTNCPGNPNDSLYNNGQCYDGMRVWNQVRPGVFDGGYAFTSYFPGGMGSGSQEVEGLPSGMYMIEVVPPVGYEILKSQDKNVDFGDEYQPDPINLLPPVCVGETYKVPNKLSLFPEPAPLAGQNLNLCDHKLISLTPGKNAAVDFFLFTEVPIAAHGTGVVFDDLANETNVNSPNFGEKFAPPWLPVSIHDWTGQEISRVYTDRWGHYDFLVPSTYTANIPSPSGMSPNMLILCMNSADPIPDPNHPGQWITDPYHNPRYREVCYTLNFMPGTTTYLDTPVIASSAFAGSLGFPVDCELPNGTPKIYSVTSANGGPYIAATGETLTIQSEGMVSVSNPAYDGPDGATPLTITRDYSFGTQVGNVTLDGNALTIESWSDDAITATVPDGLTTGQLIVTRGDNQKSTIIGVTVTVGGPEPRRVLNGDSIQTAINQASPNELILISPGQYDEMIIMWKPVRLQGWGAGSTLINASKKPAEKLQQWRNRMNNLVSNGRIDLLPGQLGTFVTEEGAGITVVAKQTGGRRFQADPNARIDGLTIVGADVGGAIFVNGYADYLEISNNSLINNNGTYGGGIRIGHPTLTTGTAYVDAQNDNIRIHHNHIAQNAGLNEVGGGISICNGTDNYAVTGNFICGNFTTGSGAGIGHTGLNDQGLIAHNTIIFNQSFNQGIAATGGGIVISGNVPLAGQTLTEGSGTVTIDGNLILGNLAGAGDGGGIELERVNGQDVQANPSSPSAWYQINLFNNMIVNNLTGLAGGGVAMQDVAAVKMINNTIAYNDSTATARAAFIPGSASQSLPQPAGIVSRVHSNALQQAFATSTVQTFPSPQPFVNNIIWHNRSFYWLLTNEGDFGLIPNISLGGAPVYADLAVLGTTGMLNPQASILTDTTGYDASNISTDPTFVNSYFNGGRSSILNPADNVIQAIPGIDEGGNFIDVQFGPLSLVGDYHIQANSPAVDAGIDSILGQFVELAKDFDEEPRPRNNGTDIGADEIGSFDSMGPAMLNVTVTWFGTNAFRLTATASDTASGNSKITAVEWWLGDGEPQPLWPIGENSLDSEMEVGMDIVVSNLPMGVQILFVRSRDAAGNWGEPARLEITVPEIITVESIRYNKKQNKLIVKAISNATPDSKPTITVIAHNDGNSDVTLGTLKYFPAQNKYSGTFTDISSQPDNITLTSSIEASVTVAVPYP